MVTLFIDKDNEIYILNTKVAIGLQPGKHLFGGTKQTPNWKCPIPNWKCLKL